MASDHCDLTRVGRYCQFQFTVYAPTYGRNAPTRTEEKSSMTVADVEAVQLLSQSDKADPLLDLI